MGNHAKYYKIPSYNQRYQVLTKMEGMGDSIKHRLKKGDQRPEDSRKDYGIDDSAC
jgi:hypothetical protein